MYFPAVHDERTTLVNYLEQQLNAVRDASHGLTEEQARSRPLPSELSLPGLLKHVAWCMSGALAGAGHEPDPDLDLGDFYGTFALAADESLERMREIYARLCERYLDMVGSADLDATMPMGPFPWYGVTQPSEGALRYLVVHHVENSPGTPGTPTCCAKRSTAPRPPSSTPPWKAARRTTSSRPGPRRPEGCSRRPLTDVAAELLGYSAAPPAMLTCQEIPNLSVTRP